ERCVRYRLAHHGEALATTLKSYTSQVVGNQLARGTDKVSSRTPEGAGSTSCTSAQYAATSPASTSTLTACPIRSTDRTSRALAPFRTRRPTTPASGPCVTRTISPSLMNGTGSYFSVLLTSVRRLSISTSGIGANSFPNATIDATP